ncbi:dihydrolipoamide dehydrogenase [Nonlabens sp. Asnod3-H03]|uniref:dihydrolipoamide dehydrogenase n=1 Tax=Nonlabens sp. Asnod3-H03 TaxID=3160580 RepID=UPI0038702D35
MKKLALLFTLAVVLISCEGPQGPPGFDGLDGSDFVAQSYERVRSITAPDYNILINHPNDIVVFETDVILVYKSFGQITASDGLPTDVWRLLPQTVYTDFGEFQYNYDYTFDDVEIFLDGPLSTDFNLLDTEYTDNQIFRIIILPAELASNPLIDITDYDSVMNLAGLTTQDIITIE